MKNFAKFLLPAFIFVLLIVPPSITLAASEQRSAGTCVNFVTGGIPWVNPSNAEVSDNSYAVGTTDFDIAPVYEDILRLSFTGAGIGEGTNHWQDGAVFNTTEETDSEGGAADLWALTLTPSRVNNTNFSVMLSAVGGDLLGYTDTLRCYDFGFNIDSGATIDGVVVEVDRKSVDNGGVGEAYIDHVRMTIYYTEGGGGSPSPPSLSGSILTAGVLSCVSFTGTGDSATCSVYDIDLYGDYVDWYMQYHNQLLARSVLFSAQIFVYILFFGLILRFTWSLLIRR